MPVVGALAVAALLDLDEEPSLRVGLGRARDTAVQPLERDRGRAAGQPDAVGDRGHRADGCVLTARLGDEQHALLVADLDGQGHVHVGEDDDVVEWDEQQLAHDRFTLLVRSISHV